MFKVTSSHSFHAKTRHGLFLKGLCHSTIWGTESYPKYGSLQLNLRKLSFCGCHLCMGGRGTAWTAAVFIFRVKRLRKNSPRSGRPSFSPLSPVPLSPRPEKATTLNNRANLERQIGRFTQAEADYNSALLIQRGLEKADARLYRMDLAYTLNGLGALYAQTDRAEQAIAPLSESLEFRFSLAEENPKIYMTDLLSGLNNLARALHLVNNPQAVSRFCQESADHLDKLRISPHIGNAPDYEALCGMSPGG
jgi:tetratricopeptide (TPR) repeat protein